MILDVSNLKKTFSGSGSDVTVLDGVSLSLAAGEVVALTGESGSGKSTLLHIVGGLEPADSGQVVFEDSDLTKLGDAARAELRRTSIGIVFQQFNLIPSLTARQNLGFQARLAGQAEPDLSALADALGITDQLDKYPEDLSGGQQQRVAIGRAIAASPKLVLADEPTGNLDEATGGAVFDILLQLARDRGTGLLIATHSDRLANAADRRLHLSHGRFPL